MSIYQSSIWSLITSLKVSDIGINFLLVNVQVGVAAFDLRSASLHLSQYIETSRSYQNTKTVLHFYDPMIIIVSPNKMAPDGMMGVSELVDKHYSANKKVSTLFI